MVNLLLEHDIKANYRFLVNVCVVNERKFSHQISLIPAIVLPLAKKKHQNCTLTKKQEKYKYIIDKASDLNMQYDRDLLIQINSRGYNSWVRVVYMKVYSKYQH